MVPAIVPARFAAAGGVAVALSLGAAAPAYAFPVDEVRGGVLLQGVGPFADGDGNEDGVGINGEILFDSPSVLRWLGSPRPHAGFTAALSERETSQGYAGLTWRVAFARKFFIEAGGGIAVHDGETSYEPGDPLVDDTTYLGCRVLARGAGDIGYMLAPRLSVSVNFSHISNAGLCSENEGLETLGLRLGLRL